MINDETGQPLTPSHYTEIADFLNQRLRDKIRELSIYFLQANANRTERNGFGELKQGKSVREQILDLTWVSNQLYLSALTTPSGLRQVLTLLEQKEKERTRLDFIIKITTELRLYLGQQGFVDLVTELTKAMNIGPTDGNLKSKSVMSLLNREINTVDPEVLVANPWIVPIIIYGLDSRTATTIHAEANKIEELIEGQ